MRFHYNCSFCRGSKSVVCCYATLTTLSELFIQENFWKLVYSLLQGEPSVLPVTVKSVSVTTTTTTTTTKTKQTTKKMRPICFIYSVSCHHLSGSLNDQLPVGLIAQLVRALHRYRRGHGFESRSSLNFFQA